MTAVFVTSASISPYNRPTDWSDAGHQIELVGCGGQSGAASTGTSGRGGGGGGGGAYTELDYSSGALSGTTAFYVGINSATTANGTALATKWGLNSNTVVTNSYYAEAGRAGSTVSGGSGGNATTVSNGTPPTPVYTKTVGRNGGIGNAAAAVIGGGAGGGGAAGPAANGGGGGSGGATAGFGGGGGGAGNNASNGVASSSATGGAGGTGVGPSHGGGAGSSTTSGGNGSAGIGGQGGGGGCGFATTTASQVCSGYAGGSRGNVTDWVQTSNSATAGAGAGGGGGGGASGNVATTSAGGNGGNYGGGGGGAGGTRGANSGGVGSGASGLIVIQYAQVGPVAFGSAGTYLTYTSRTNSTLVAPSGIADGDLLIAYFFTARASSTLTPAAPAGWSTLSGSPILGNDTSFFGAYNIFYKIASGESGNYVFTHTVGSTCGLVIRYTGVDTATPFSPTPTTNSGTTGPTATATGFTTTVDNTFVVFAGFDWASSANDLVPPTGTTTFFVERADQVLMYVADGTLATAGATSNQSHTCNSISNPNNPWGAYLIGLKPASPVVVPFMYAKRRFVVWR